MAPPPHRARSAGSAGSASGRSPCSGLVVAHDAVFIAEYGASSGTALAATGPRLLDHVRGPRRSCAPASRSRRASWASRACGRGSPWRGTAGARAGAKGAAPGGRPVVPRRVAGPRPAPVRRHHDGLPRPGEPRAPRRGPRASTASGCSPGRTTRSPCRSSLGVSLLLAAAAAWLRWRGAVLERRLAAAGGRGRPPGPRRRDPRRRPLGRRRRLGRPPLADRPAPRRAGPAARRWLPDRPPCRGVFRGPAVPRRTAGRRRVGASLRVAHNRVPSWDTGRHPPRHRPAPPA